jgi:hypothetical protein
VRFTIVKNGLVKERTENFDFVLEESDKQKDMVLLKVEEGGM